jgi:hypothetical protein
MGARYWTCLLVMGALPLGCGPRQAAEHVPGTGPELDVRVIEGRAVDLDFVATRAGQVNSGIMKLITAAGDTFLLLTPAAVRCKPGTDGGDVGIGEGEMIRVYLRASDARLARKQYVPVELAEVQCIQEDR